MVGSEFTKFLFAILLLGQLSTNAQDLSQTIRGRVVDLVTYNPMYAATVAVCQDSLMHIATITDAKGYFRMENVPLGRYSVVVSYIGYRQSIIPDVIVNSGKEILLSVEMEESPMAIEEIQVSATKGKGKALNKLAFVSARTFSVDEAERYAGSRADPARMASNYAGVQGSNDSNNDLVIRGNSPLGVLWRLEGVNIPNPNHFGVTGTTGGPVTILNNKVLSLSDFMTGAFPAEYGNSMAGVFDLRMRNGNNEQHEFSGQLGILGTELMAEGPLSKKKKSSYLAAYRYSTLEMLLAMNIRIGTDAVPKYQDFSFKMNFPARKHGNFSIFGIGGKSAVDILASEQLAPDDDDIYGQEAMDEHFRTGVGVVGANYTRPLGSSSMLKLTLSSSIEHQRNQLDKVFRHIENELYMIDSIRYSHNAYHSNQYKNSLSVIWNKKVNSKNSLRTGVITDLYIFDVLDSIFNEVRRSHIIRMDHSGPALLIQPFLQWKMKPTKDLSMTAGVHGQIMNLEDNLSTVVEPRFGLRYRINDKNAIGFGTGLHSQMLPTYIYFAQHLQENGPNVIANANLGFIKSYHNVLSWDHNISQQMRIKVESYYQYLYNVPVEYKSSSYSALDEGHNLERFFPDSLVNKGTGSNVGLELTVERFFSKSYFVMLTASLYDAKRTGSDGINYDAIFNGRYVINALASKEFSWGVKSRSSFTIGGKVTLAGGKRCTPIDLLASADAGEVVYIDAQRNFSQLAPYFRADIKLNYRLNADKTTHEIGLDIVNVTAKENILKQTYVHGDEDPITEINQLGLLPLFYYRVDF